MKHNIVSIEIVNILSVQAEKTKIKDTNDSIQEENAVTGSEDDDLHDMDLKSPIDTPLFEHFIVVGASPEVFWCC